MPRRFRLDLTYGVLGRLFDLKGPSLRAERQSLMCGKVKMFRSGIGRS